MTHKLKILSVYGISLLFVAVNTYLIVHEKWYGMAAPLALLLVLLYVFSLDKVLLLITFLTPLAVSLKSEEFGLGVSLPTEPLMMGVLLIFILKMFNGTGYDQRIVRHPVSMAIFINLAWILITTITSEIPLVSVKYLIARLWFVVPFYFMGILLFKDIRNLRKFNWLYAVPLAIVIFYALFNHAQWGFDKPSSNMVMKPFYNDHTAYGAVIAMFLPVFTGLIFLDPEKKTLRIPALAITVILIIGIIFSYSRAAWLSVAVAAVIFLIVLFRIRLRWVLLSVAVLVGFFFMFRYQFIDKLEKNKQDSSTDFVEHVQSISNISSDASNLERINRWQSAFRMFEEKPIFGWGPGTYQFVYAPYQRSKERTIISTNYGDMGNAHSEYFGPLSESGILGMLTFIAIVVTVIITALRVRRQSKNWYVRWFVVLILLGLVTYYIHGLLNNFLDTDKASVPFWAFTGMIVAMDLYHKRKSDDKIREEFSS